MDNQAKRYLAGLEARVLKIEQFIQSIDVAMQSSIASTSAPSCNQCGIFDPANNGYVCSTPDCCQGLNPADDE